MNTKVNFTVSIQVATDATTATYTVSKVTSQAGDDITREFMDFCITRELALDSEENLRNAALAFGRG